MFGKPVRIGVIGCGDVMTAYMYQAQILRGQGLVEVVAACDRRPERLRLMQERYGVRTCTSDPEQLLASDQVDLVLILTSMVEHGPLALQALQAGKHVLVEKPMAVDLQIAAQMVEQARSAPGYLLCAPHVLLSPTYQIIGSRLQQGDLGKVCLARARYGHAGPTWGPWYYQQGGGALFDLAPYNITSLTGWLGPVRRVLAMTGTAIPERLIEGQTISVKIEDNAHVLLDFGESCFAVVTAAFTMQQYRSPAIELYGSLGTIQMMGDDWDPDGYELWLNQVGAWQVFKETDPGWLWTDGLRHLVHCILTGTPPQITPRHAYHVLEVLLRAQEAGRDGQPRWIESVFPPLQFTAHGQLQAQHLVHDRTHQRD